jgi:drug/metabolite transporter (DMT)-like permease
MSAAGLSPDELRRRRQGYLALLAVQLFFGLFPLFGKVAFADFTPRAISAWRIAGGAAALLAVAFAVHGRGALPRRGDLPRLFACAVLGVVANMLLFLEGLQRSTAVNTALLLPLIPVFTAAVAIALRQEPFVPVRALGMAVAFAGASLVLFQEGADLSSSYMAGNLMIVVNELCYAVYLVIARPLLGRHPPLVVIAWVFGLSVWAVPLFLGEGSPAFPESATAKTWLSLGYIVVFPTILAYLLNVYALARVSASTTAAFIFLQPMVTIVGGVLALGERLPDHWIAAAALTVGGVWIVARHPVARPLVPAGERGGGGAGAPPR